MLKKKTKITVDQPTNLKASLKSLKESVATLRAGRHGLATSRGLERLLKNKWAERTPLPSTTNKAWSVQETENT
jgi:hypothetical protein